VAPADVDIEPYVDAPVPAWRRYSYFVSPSNQVVLVDPMERRVVRVIEATDLAAARHQSPPRAVHFQPTRWRKPAISAAARSESRDAGSDRPQEHRDIEI
jgi:hypothetical protein